MTLSVRHFLHFILEFPLVYGVYVMKRMQFIAIDSDGLMSIPTGPGLGMVWCKQNQHLLSDLYGKQSACDL